MKTSELILTNQVWDNSLCEPVLITYNRAQHLEETLTAFYKVKEYGIHFHVLDNCSTDNTAAIVKKWQNIWPNLVYHKNVYNIGGNANILRALEITQSEYAWILGDDDSWHLDEIDDLIEAMKSQTFDIIRLGWLVSDAFAGKSAEATTIVKEEQYFFASLSMISSTMIRKKIITATLPYAYHNIANAYPQLVAPMMAFEQQPLTVYSLKQALLTHTPSQNPGFFLGDLEWYVAWFRTASYLQNPVYKKKFISETIDYMIRPKKGYFRSFLWLLKVALNAKAHGVSQIKYLAELFILGEGWRLRIFFIALIYTCLPGFIARGLRQLYYKCIRKPLNKLQYDRSRI